MNLSSASSTNGFVLATLLPGLLILMLFYTFYAVEIHRETIQQNLLKEMDHFSLIEMVVLRKTCTEFMTFDPHDFDMELNGVLVRVEFNDETARITYGEPINHIAYLSFDMVFESVLDYRIVPTSDSD